MGVEKAKNILSNCYVMTTKHILDDENKKLKEAIKIVIESLNNYQSLCCSYQSEIEDLKSQLEYYKEKESAENDDWIDRDGWD